MERVPLRRLVDCLDGQRVPLNREERSELRGSIPYWGSNGVVDHVSRHLFDEELVLLGEDGAPFDDRNRDVSFHVTGTVWVNNHIHVLRPSGVDGRFLSYALNAIDWMPFVTGSTRLKLTQDDMMRAPVTVHSAGRQRRIADFLDEETARIGALIANKQQMLELEQERFLAAIRQLVTSDAWFEDPLEVRPEECPPETRPLRLSWMFRLGSGTTPRAGDPLMYGPGSAWVTTGDLRDGPIAKALRQVTPAALERYSALKVHPAGSLVVAMYGATIGRLGMLPVAATVNQACCVLSPRCDVQPEFVFYWLLAHRSDLVRRGLGAGQPNISAEVVGQVRIAVPDAPAQRNLVRAARVEEQRRNSLLDTLTLQIALLRERRQALITAAVTGEIEV